jgi:hypothetical protein
MEDLLGGLIVAGVQGVNSTDTVSLSARKPSLVTRSQGHTIRMIALHGSVEREKDIAKPSVR